MRPTVVKDNNVKDATRKNNILDSAILTSDHNVVCMTPVYKSKLKRGKPEMKVIRTWTNESKEQQACLDCTDWNTFRDKNLSK